MQTSYRLAINGRFLTQRLTGVQRYAQEVLRALDSILNESAWKGVSVTLFVPPKTDVSLQLSHIRIVEGGIGRGYFWEQVSLPLLARKCFLLNLCNLGPLLHTNKATIIHDAAPAAIPEAFSLSFRLAYRVLVPLVAATSRSIMTVSEFSRQEIANFYGINSEKIIVVYAGGDHILRSKADVGILSRLGVAKGQFFLAIGVGAKNKNLPLSLSAFSNFHTNNPNVLFVVTGNRDKNIFKEVHFTKTNGIILAGYVSEEELRALYEHCTALIFPSTYEGFGIPPLEAMTLGTPVIISTQPALQEISLNSALSVNPTDSPTLENHMQRLSHEPALRKELQRLGFKRSQELTWKRTAKQILSTISQIAPN
ncbi:MAG TPA: glycosyltransferase family 1 protein [Alphaproteobacteria bacterium]|jgi:glycosyltransferase involved in cell wall biosynthesis